MVERREYPKNPCAEIGVTRAEPLMTEAFSVDHGVWFSNSRTLMIGEMIRPTAELYLQETPERYYYPPEWRGRVRVSYMEF
jgi:hypothetical protein